MQSRATCAPAAIVAGTLAVAVCGFFGFCGSAAAQSRQSTPIPPLPQVYETDVLTIRVVEIAGGLANPWSMAWLPNGDLLVTERAGRLRIVRNGRLDPTPIPGVPEVRRTVLGGLLDVLLHPEFETNGFVYLSYSKGGDDNRSTTAIARGRFDGSALNDVRDIFVAENWSTSPTNSGGRMVFGRDGMLYVAVGERQVQDRAQDPMEQ